MSPALPSDHRAVYPCRQAVTSSYQYLDPAVLSRSIGGPTVRWFRGRIVRDEVSGALRFYANRTSRRDLPKDWSAAQEWTDEFDLKDIEWLGKQPRVLGSPCDPVGLPPSRRARSPHPHSV